MDTNSGLQRRDFHKLALASLGGIAAGTVSGANDATAQDAKKVGIMSPVGGVPPCAGL